MDDVSFAPGRATTVNAGLDLPTASQNTFTQGDVVIDQSDADSDRLVLTVGDDLTVPDNVVVRNIETIQFKIDAVTAGDDTIFTADVGEFTNARTYEFDVVAAGSAINALEVLNMENQSTIKASADFLVVDVEANKSASYTLLVAGTGLSSASPVRVNTSGAAGNVKIEGAGHLNVVDVDSTGLVSVEAGASLTLDSANANAVIATAEKGNLTVASTKEANLVILSAEEGNITVTKGGVGSLTATASGTIVVTDAADTESVNLKASGKSIISGGGSIATATLEGNGAAATFDFTDEADALGAIVVNGSEDITIELDASKTALDAEEEVVDNLLTVLDESDGELTINVSGEGALNLSQGDVVDVLNITGTLVNDVSEGGWNGGLGVASGQEVNFEASQATLKIVVGLEGNSNTNTVTLNLNDDSRALGSTVDLEGLEVTQAASVTINAGLDTGPGGAANPSTISGVDTSDTGADVTINFGVNGLEFDGTNDLDDGTLTLTGSGAVSDDSDGFGNLTAAALDASAVTGGFGSLQASVAISQGTVPIVRTGSGADFLELTGAADTLIDVGTGKGADVLTLSDDTYDGARVAIDLGEGADTLVLKTGTALQSTDPGKITLANVETIRFDDGAAIDGDLLSGKTYAVEHQDGSASDVTISVRTTDTSLSFAALVESGAAAKTLKNTTFKIDASENTAPITIVGFTDAINNIVGAGSLDGDSLVGGNLDDTFQYDDAADLMNPLTNSGIDTIVGGKGTDSLLVGSDFSVVAKDSFANFQSVEQILLDAENTDIEVSLVLGTTAETAGITTIDLAQSSKGNVVNVSSFKAAGVTIVAEEATGDNRLTGGAGDDTFEMGANLTSTDIIAGGAGTDTLSFQDAAKDGADLDKVTGVEVIVLAQDAEEDAAGTTVETKDTLVAAGATLTVDGAELTGALDWNGSLETNGRFNITAGSGDDTVTVGDGDDTVVGGAGDDTITAGDGADSLAGGDGDDKFTLGINLTAADTIVGGSGEEAEGDALTFTDADGDDTDLDNVSGIETITVVNDDEDDDVAITTVDSLVAAGETLTLTADGFTNDDYTVVFDGSKETDGSFNIETGGSTDTITVGAGNDTVTAGAGDDTITAGAGRDSLIGGAGSDTFIFAGNLTSGDFVNGDEVEAEGGGGDEDTLLFTDTNGKTTDLNGVTNVEIIVLGNTTTNVAITTQDDLIAAARGLEVDASALTTGTLTWDGSDEADGAQSVTGGGANDTITGGAGSDTLTGGAGNDRLTGNGGSDVFVVTAGTDTITDLFSDGEGKGGDDVLEVSVGATVVASSEGFTDATDTVNNGTVTINATGNVDLSNAEGANGFTVVSNSAEGITFTASNQGDTLTGGAGEDTLTGGDGADSLSGGGANDTLEGSVGADTLVGGAGDDSLIGGDGDDLFVITAGTDDIDDLETGDAFTVAAGATLIVNLGVDAEGGSEFIATAATTNSSTVSKASITAIEAATIDLSLAGGTAGYTILRSGKGDTITGSTFADVFDLLDAEAEADGDNVVITGGGNDTVNGGDGADTITVTGGTVSIDNFGDGADVLVVNKGATAAVTVSKDFTDATDSVFTGITSFTLEGVRAINLSEATGTAGVSITAAKADAATVTVTGTVNADTITGGGAGDTVTSSGGVDVVSLGAGNDTVTITDAAHAVAGLSLNGGLDTEGDTLVIRDTDVDLSIATITGFENLDLGEGEDTVASVILTADQFNDFDAEGLVADAEDTITINDLDGAEVAATVANDVYLFASGDKSVAITDFAKAGTDVLDFSAILGDGFSVYKDEGIVISGEDTLDLLTKGEATGSDIANAVFVWGDDVDALRTIIQSKSEANELYLVDGGKAIMLQAYTDLDAQILFVDAEAEGIEDVTAFRIWQIEGDGSGDETFTLIGTVSFAAGAGDLLVDNFGLV
jgi:Ca2+-binding RTX toxin-like protein